MKNILKTALCFILMSVILFSFSGCSSNNELTEENVIATVGIVDTALKEFDSKTLTKYVDSSTLSYIIKFSEGHEQYAELGKAIFANLEIEVEAVDLEAKTVTVNVTNKNLYNAATNFTTKLFQNYNRLSLLTKLDDESFLDTSLYELVDSIGKSVLTTESTVTLSISQGKKNLVLSFDEEAENAVSGGALTAIKELLK